jgi:hypothetical protein
MKIGMLERTTPEWVTLNKSDLYVLYGLVLE